MFLWQIESRSQWSQWNPSEVFGPVALTLTDNLETELSELRVTAPDRVAVVTLVDPELTFEADGLRIEGHVNRRRSGTDPIECWVAQPVLEGFASPVPWRAEIVEKATGDSIDVIEPATIQEVEAVRNAVGAWTLLRDVSLDEYFAVDEGDEWEWMLLIRGPRSKKRWVDEYDIRSLNRFEVTLEGTAKHRGMQTEVLVKLTPSEISRAAQLLGEPA
jgi:hypothetical protein